MLNVHPHVLALDGVYIRRASDGPLLVRALPTPTHAEVADVARRTADRIENILQAHGRSLDPEMQDDEPPGLALDQPGLAACYAAAAQGVITRQEALHYIAQGGALLFLGSVLTEADAAILRSWFAPLEVRVEPTPLAQSRVATLSNHPLIENL